MELQKATTPNRLFNALQEHFQLTTDFSLAEQLGVQRAYVGRLRKSYRELSGNVILLIYDKTGWSIERIRELTGLV